MPIYAYRCQDCGFAKDVLQKVSDAPLTECPSCGKPGFRKQLTAAGFQLKGTGWYATDFRGGNSSGKSNSSTGADSNGNGGANNGADGGANNGADNGSKEGSATPAAGSGGDATSAA